MNQIVWITGDYDKKQYEVLRKCKAIYIGDTVIKVKEAPESPGQEREASTE